MFTLSAPLRTQYSRPTPIFFLFWSFLINIREKNPDKSFFSKFDIFESRQSIRRDLWKSHVSSLSATHFYVGIGSNINLIGPSIIFGIQNESHHIEWRDSSMSHATSFGVIGSDFFIIYCSFITKNK
jgi:hypothetical protein